MSSRISRQFALAGNRNTAIGAVMSMIASATFAKYYNCTASSLVQHWNWLTSQKLELFASDDALKKHVMHYDSNKLHFPSPKNQKPIVLVACGSFSPPTIFHLRMLEDARDGLRSKGYTVAAGLMSPTHSKYGKASLVDMYHRINMLRLALQDSDWIQIHPWECMQDEWTPTAHVLSMMQDEISKLYPGARVMLLCGADLLESFPSIKANGEPVWDPEHQQLILRKCGVVCMEREGTDLDQVIAQHDTLRQNKANIITFKPSSQNSISSTLVRKLLRNGDSIKYLVHENVRKYIYEQDLKSKAAWT